MRVSFSPVSILDGDISYVTGYRLTKGSTQNRASTTRRLAVDLSALQIDGNGSDGPKRHPIKQDPERMVDGDQPWDQYATRKDRSGYHQGLLEVATLQTSTPQSSLPSEYTPYMHRPCPFTMTFYAQYHVQGYS